MLLSMQSNAAKRARCPGLAAIVLGLLTVVGCAAPPNLELPTLGGLQVWADFAQAFGRRPENEDRS